MWFPATCLMSHWISKHFKFKLRSRGTAQVSCVQSSVRCWSLIHPVLFTAQHPSLTLDKNFIYTLIFITKSIGIFPIRRFEFIIISMSGLLFITQSCDWWGHPHLLRLGLQLNPKLWIWNGTQSDSPYGCISCDAISPMVRAVFVFVLAGSWFIRVWRIFAPLETDTISFIKMSVIRITPFPSFSVRFQWRFCMCKEFDTDLQSCKIQWVRGRKHKSKG